jgi:hypothetical protein
MIEQLRSTLQQKGTAQGSTGRRSCLVERLHQLAAYGALAIIAAIVFGTGALRL